MLKLIACWYLLVSLLTFGAYALDKLAAIRGRRRWPESSLHLLELLGGWPGALAAQRTLRHKSSKTRFVVITWLIAGLHVGALAAGWWLRR
jgi:uncharacterized membrane protein YsdA (DUF1294 family)